MPGHRRAAPPAESTARGPARPTRATGTSDNAFQASQLPDEAFPHQGILEALMGEDLSHVRVREGGDAALAGVRADGMAHGDEVTVPTNPTLDVMAHEVAHVLQNDHGTPAATLSQPGDASEREADAAADKAMRGEPISIQAAPTGAFAGGWLSDVGDWVSGVVDSVFGGSSSEQAPTPAQTPASDPQAPMKQAGLDIASGYTGKQATDPKLASKLVKLDTPEQREAALNGFTQNQSADPKWEEMCGAHTMMASVMMGGGNEGVGDLAKSLANKPGLAPDEKEALLAVAEAAKSGTLMRADMDMLTSTMHQRMKQSDIDDKNAGFGVTGKAMQQLGADNPAIEAAMKKGNMTPTQIDTDADGKTNHWVLRMGVNTPDASVYDPFQTKTGTQVVKDPAQVARYKTASGG
jgi:hypothetical protein